MNQTFKLIGFISALLGGVIFAGGDPVTWVDLGEGLAVRVGYEMNCKFIYLPGRDVPIALPYLAYVMDAKLSPDRKHLLFVIYRGRADNSGSDYCCCLYCIRSDTSAAATWACQFIMHDTTLDLMFDRETVIASIVLLDDSGKATLEICQSEKRVPPDRILRTKEEWDLNAPKRLKILSHHEP